jgi:YesN/AraC family two-component response regulator
MTIDITILKTITLLYVEDEDGIRAQELKAYNKLFKKVYSCKDGLDAYNVFQENKDDIDIIVTDINMPNMTGLELIEKINPISNIPFIFTTAYSDIDYMKTAINLGATKYITKPINIKTVIEDIQEAVVLYRKHKNVHNLANKLIQKSKNTESEISKLMNKNKILENNLALYKNITTKHTSKIAINNNAIIIEVSDEFTNVFQYTKDKLLNQNISVLKSSTADNTVFQKLMLESLYEKSFKTIKQLTKLKDTTVECNITINPIFNTETLYLDKYDVYFSKA